MKYDFLKRYCKNKDLKRRAESIRQGTLCRQIAGMYEGEELTTLYREGGENLIITIHGGGFAYNSVFDEDYYCAYLASVSGFSTASLDYTLTYKRQYPVQLNQCHGQIKTLIETMRPKGKIVLIGHSAGANLAAALTIKALRDKSYTVSAQVLNYPLLNSVKTAKQRKRYPFTFSNRTIDDFAELYCPKEQRGDPLVSPLFLGAEETSLLPPALIIKAKGDRLGEDAEGYYEKLSDCGVKAEIYRAEMRHGFIEDGMKKIYSAPHAKMTAYAKTVTDYTAEKLKELLGN